MCVRIRSREIGSCGRPCRAVRFCTLVSTTGWSKTMQHVLAVVIVVLLTMLLGCAPTAQTSSGAPAVVQPAAAGHPAESSPPIPFALPGLPDPAALHGRRWPAPRDGQRNARSSKRLVPRQINARRPPPRPISSAYGRSRRPAPPVQLGPSMQASCQPGAQTRFTRECVGLGMGGA
jgi:hypothetical protein